MAIVVSKKVELSAVPDVRDRLDAAGLIGLFGASSKKLNDIVR
jgi:hypothetical protein